MPVMAVLVTGKQNRHFEAGVGAIASTGSDVVVTATLGSRFQRPGPGPVFRIGLVGFVFRGIALPFAGASLVYAF